MIFFDCRHCGEPNADELDDDHLGQYARIPCSKCGKDNYVKQSRIDCPVLTYEEISAMPGFGKVPA